MRSVLLICAFAISACSTTLPSPPIAPSRAKPVEVLAACPLTCKVRAEAENLELEDQIALIQGCWVANMTAYAECSARQFQLAEWVKAE